MIKTIYLARRNPETTHEEFLANWRQHAVLAGSVPSVGRRFTAVVQCRRLRGPDGERLAAGYDGANLLSLTSLLESVDVYDQAGIDTLRTDELRVFDDYVSESSITVHESVLRDQPIGAVVLLEFVRRRPGVSPADFIRAWTGAYARTLLAADAFTAAAGRYVHNHVILPTPPGHDYDGFSETWFAQPEDATAFLAAVEDQPELRSPEGFEIPLRALLQVSHAWFAATG
jgi:hypothetical protein